jgi:hypothetical protein
VRAVSSRSVGSALAASVLGVLLLATRTAHGDDRSERLRVGRVPDLPAPFVVPDLTHSRFDVRGDWLVGSASPVDPSRSQSAVAVFRPSVEAVVLAPRRIYVGGSYPIGAALPPDGGLAPGEVGRPSGTRTAMLGNAEAHIRAVFPLPTWLEIGFTLGVAAPTATHDRSWRPNRAASEAISTLDPTSYVSFLPGRVALRPGGDLRILRGPLVFQGRHGIDVVIDGAGTERVAPASRLLAHAGYLVRNDLEVSIEASQVYFFASNGTGASPAAPGVGPERAFAERYRVSDDRRSAFVWGPAVRAMFGDVDVGAALVTNLDSPLSPSVASFVGLRVSIVGHVGGMR